MLDKILKLSDFLDSNSINLDIIYDDYKHFRQFKSNIESSKITEYNNIIFYTIRYTMIVYDKSINHVFLSYNPDIKSIDSVDYVNAILGINCKICSVGYIDKYIKIYKEFIKDKAFKDIRNWRIDAVLDNNLDRYEYLEYCDSIKNNLNRYDINYNMDLPYDIGLKLFEYKLDIYEINAIFKILLNIKD